MKTRIALAVIITLIGSLARADQPTTRPAKPDARTLAAWERVKSMAGSWRGKSSKGWTEELSVQLIAGGTCVLETSRFAHGEDPQNAMATVYHLDGPYLMLTHYCMAKNQPRLRASRIDNDGKDVTFEFLDGTNMSSRDVGHMDKVVFHFINSDHYTSQWTFYAKGAEKWMEEISYERAPEPATQPDGAR